MNTFLKMAFALALAIVVPIVSGDGSVFAEEAANGRQIALDGIPGGQAPCASCHLTNGQGQPAVGIPRLAGMNARLIEEQLQYFAQGQRKSAPMARYAVALTPEQRHAVAAFYASLPSDGRAQELPASKSQIERGASLYLNGDQHTQMQACAACHGQTGLGVGQFSPRLAGQSSVYVARQLMTWRSGDDRDPQGKFMRGVVHSLTDADIAAVSAYIARLD
jgi:cytochrome c553